MRKSKPSTLFLTLISFYSLYSFVPFFVAQSTSPDALAMQELKRGLTVPSSLKWSDPNPCYWQQVRCDSNGRVIRIHLGNSDVSGNLSPAIANLTSLQVLELFNTKISGPLPSLHYLSSLQTLNIMNCQFNFIPDDFFNGLTSLREAYLDSNPFQSWSIPEGLTTALSLKNFSANAANVVGKIPDFLNSSTFPGMIQLHLSGNSLQGGLPAGFSGFSIQSMWLNGQKDKSGTRTLNGSIEVLMNMTELIVIWLNSNGLTGPIPDLSGLTSLSYLDLRDNSLTGLVPTSLPNLTTLRVVNLTNNGLQGPAPKFPASVSVDIINGTNSFCLPDPGVACDGRVTALIEFLEPFGNPFLFAQNWRGNDPCTDWMGITCSNGNITTINLQGKGLTGTISPVIATLNSVEVLIISHNNISGTIPEELASMPNLKKLDVSFNQLCGNVPSFAHTDVNTVGNADIGQDHSSSGSPPGRTTGYPSGGGGGSGSGSTSKAGKIVGFVVGCVCAAAIVVISAFCFVKVKQKKLYGRVQSPNAVVVLSNHLGFDDTVEMTSLNSCTSEGVMSELYGKESSMVMPIQVLRRVTNNFSEENILGKGGFGTVYKGELQDGTKIAVKRMDSGLLGNKGLEEFKSEIAVLTKVRHRHLVSLLGYCLDANEKLLVYECMPQGTLSRHLFNWKEEGLKPLEWKKRLIIALDVARGVEYLHNLAQQSFIHRDLKPSNILLGDDMRAKVSDFGLVRLAPDGKASIQTKLAGTFGYLSPEYAVTGRVTTKIDVYSFGVILMEMITGRKAIDETLPEDRMYLVAWFWRMCTDNDTFQKAIDPTINLDEETLVSIDTVAVLAKHCTAREPYQRPNMGHAVNVLSSLLEMWKPYSSDDSGDLNTM